MSNKRVYGDIHLYNNDAMDIYNEWETPVTIISDGPYGVKGFPGDLDDYHLLADWYEPHIKKWTEKSTPMTTLWFWNTEQGWANVHPMLEKYGWEYKSSNVWDKGKNHMAGKTNTKTISHFPIVTEVCVQYVKKPVFYDEEGNSLSMKEWLRYEWKKTGLPLYKTNEATGVKDAATRKYFTLSNLWYMPPAEAYEKLYKYANEHGDPDNKPFFSIDGKKSLTKQEWQNMKPKFYCPFGVSNVWSVPPLNGKERLRSKSGKALHLNQKPLDLIEMIVKSSTDPDDVVWDPFGGVFTTASACQKNGRKCYSAEINEEVFEQGVQRIENDIQNSITLF